MRSPTGTYHFPAANGRVRTGRAGAVGVTAVLLVLSIAATSSANHAGTTPLAAPPASPGGAGLFAGSQGAAAAPGAGVGATPDAGIGSVLSTVDLATNQSFPGAYATPAQDLPVDGIYDSANGLVYLRGYLGNDISVVNPTTGKDIVDLAVPYSEQEYAAALTIANDSLSDYLYVANDGAAANISIVDGGTNTITGSIELGAAPYSDLFDPANGDLYISEDVLGEVAVISTASNSTIATVRAGTSPEVMALDAAEHELFVANYLSSNVTVIDTETNDRVATIAVGANPAALVVDTVDNLVDVVNLGSSNLSVINAATNTIASTVHVGDAPEAAAFDPALDELFVASGGSNNVSVVSQPADTVVATVGTGHGAVGYSTVYDPATSDVYVACQGSENITVIATSSDRTIANLSTGTSLPSGALAVPATGQVYVVDEGSDYIAANLTVVGGTPPRTVGSIPLDAIPTGIVYDPYDGHLYAADAGDDATLRLNATSATVLGVLPVGPPPETVGAPIVYDSVNHDLYEVSETSSTVTALGPSGTVVATIPVGEGPDAIAFDPVNGYLYTASSYWGNVTVINGATNLVVHEVQLKLYDELPGIAVDTRTNEVFVSDYIAGNVTVFGASNFTKLATVPVGYLPQSVAYDPTNGTIFVVNSGDGNVSVISDSTLSVKGTFDLPSAGPLLYDPTNNGLYAPMTAAEIEVEAVNASTYLPLAGSPLELGLDEFPSDLTENPTNGEVFVTSAFQGSVSVIGPEAPSTYPVTFQESGLPVGTSWSVSLAGTLNSSTGNTVGFNETNGAYPFVVPTVTGYSVTPSTGTVTVDGAPVVRNITFLSHTSGPFSVTLTAGPSTIYLGNSTDLNATVSGGVAPFDYVYLDLPAGCTSQNTTRLTCAPTATGSFTVTVNVTDAIGAYAEGSASFTVKSSSTSSPAPSSSSGASLEEWGVVIAVVVVVAALLVFLVLRRRRRPAEPPAPPTAGVPPSPPPTPPAPP